MTDTSKPRTEQRNTTVDEGVAIMQAWCRYFGVDDHTTVIVPADFRAGYLAALTDSEAAYDAAVERAERAEARLTELKARGVIASIEE